MEGQGLLVHDIQVQQRKAGAAGGEEEAQFPRVLMQQGITRRRRRRGREEKEQETAGRARERLGTLKIQLPQQENGDARDAAHSTAPRPRTETEREDFAQWNIPLPQARERGPGDEAHRERERVSRGGCEGRKDPAPMRDPPLKQQR